MSHKGSCKSIYYTDKTLGPEQPKPEKVEALQVTESASESGGKNDQGNPV